VSAEPGSAVSGPVPAGYARLMDLLADGRAGHRLVWHAPEGRTEAASLLRGHPLRQAAKSIVVRVALGRKTSRYVLAVVPGDRRVDLPAVQRLVDGVRVGFADRATAERLTGCTSGSIVPFSFHDDLQVVTDPELLAQDEIWFNAARLDASVALPASTYRRLAAPVVATIIDPAVGGQSRPITEVVHA
jgi:Ala-tRNA(Pro) deacylase